MAVLVFDVVTALEVRATREHRAVSAEAVARDLGAPLAEVLPVLDDAVALELVAERRGRGRRYVPAHAAVGV